MFPIDEEGEQLRAMRYFLLIGAVIAMMATWTGAWFYVAGQVRTAVEAYITEDIPGWNITYKTLKIEGFPFRIKIDVQMPRLVLSGERGTIRWETNHISAMRHLWQPRHVLVDLTGQHRITVNRAGQTHHFIHDNDLATSSIETDEGGRLRLLSLDITSPELKSDSKATAQGKRLQIRAGWNPDSIRNVDLALRGDQITFSETFLNRNLNVQWRDIRLLDLNTTVTGLPDDMAMAMLVSQWRDGGGTVEVRQLRLQWGEVDITAKGSLALDERMRLIGALTAQIKGYEKLIDLAVATGDLGDGGEVAARAVLGLLAAAGGGILSVPVRLQDGQLFLGPAVIAKLQPLPLD